MSADKATQLAKGQTIVPFASTCSDIFSESEAPAETGPSPAQTVSKTSKQTIAN